MIICTDASGLEKVWSVNVTLCLQLSRHLAIWKMLKFQQTLCQFKVLAASTLLGVICLTAFIAPFGSYRFKSLTIWNILCSQEILEAYLLVKQTFH